MVVCNLLSLLLFATGSTGMCEPCDNFIIHNPMDPFGLTEDFGAEVMPLLIGRDVYDFVDKVKKFYYDESVWIDYSSSGNDHVTKWFGKQKSTRQLDDCFQALSSRRPYIGSF